MKWLKAIIIWIGVTIAGMAGGQGRIGGKFPRRFGIFTLTFTTSWFSKRALPLILLIPILSVGYGENSWLYEKLNNEFLVRIVYGIMVSVPFLFYGIRRWVVACLLLVGAFQIRAGSLGYVGWFGDLLIEDICRYFTLGVLISFNLFFVKD